MFGKRPWIEAIAAFALSLAIGHEAAGAPNFAGYYWASVYAGLDRNGQPVYSSSQLYVSDTADGKATIRMYLGDWDNYCGVEGNAVVESKGLAYREETDQPEGPLVLDIAISDGSAVVTWVSGPAKWNCGEHTQWGAVLGRLESNPSRTDSEAQTRDAYRTALDCFALYSFLSERAKREGGGEAQAKALDDLATNADFYVGDLARAPIAKQVEDEEEASARLSRARHRGELTATVLLNRKARCDTAIQPRFDKP